MVASQASILRLNSLSVNKVKREGGKEQLLIVSAWPLGTHAYC